MKGYFVTFDDQEARALLTPQMGGDMDGWHWDARYNEWFRSWKSDNGREFCGSVDVYSHGKHKARLCERLGLLHYGPEDLVDEQVVYDSAPAAAAVVATAAQALVDAANRV